MVGLPGNISGIFDITLFLVTTGPKGSYQDVTESKLTRPRCALDGPFFVKRSNNNSNMVYSRFAIIEERDPFRLKDKTGAPVLCFRCGKSALPDSEPSSGQSSSPTNGRETRSLRSTLRVLPGQKLWKSTVSCDHCSLHWHLDCLDPPLSSMPPAHKKWMCPAHVEHIAVSFVPLTILMKRCLLCIA
jgi:transcriptional regulatory protein PHF12/RCO1